MEIRQIVLARSAQMMKSATGAIGYLPNLVQQIKERYGFLAVPKEQDLVPPDSTKGAIFTHGRLITEDRTIVIDRFTVFNDGVVVDTASSTDDADWFVNDLIQWAKVAAPKAQPTGSRYYLSQIEIKMNEPLEVYAPVFRPTGERITTLLNGYGIKAPRYELTALNLHFDQLGKVAPQPGVFFFDRRVNFPYSENVWFSQAPLKTDDHIALLKEFEK